MCNQGDTAQSTAPVCQACVTAAAQALYGMPGWTFDQCAQRLRDQMQQAAQCYAWSVSSADDFDGTNVKCLTGNVLLWSCFAAFVALCFSTNDIHTLSFYSPLPLAVGSRP